MQDPYEFCRCGSGKKNRWCCAPLEVEIDKAWRQASMGQHEGALRTLDTLSTANSENPEVFGRKAELLFALGRHAEAEASLEKAFALRSDYPFGNYLKAAVLHDQGEMSGALILARKSLESYHPAAVGPLTRVLHLIFTGEMSQNRPIAARVALKMMLKLDPTAAEPKQLFEDQFGPNSALSEAAKREYSLLPPPATRERQTAWNKAAKTHGAGRLSGMAKMFEELTSSDKNDGAAWFNMALTQAMIGNNAKAIEALEKFFQLETDEGRLVVATGLSIVLRCGSGLEQKADFLEHLHLFPVRDPNKVVGFMQKLMEGKQFLPFPRQPDDPSINGFLLKPLSGLLVAGDSTPQYANILGTLSASPEGFKIRTFDTKAGADIVHEARQALGFALNEGKSILVGSLSDPYRELAVVNLTANTDEESLKSKQREIVKSYFTEKWPSKPLKILGDKSPKEAITTPQGRVLLLGLLKYIEGANSLISDFGFDSNGLKALLGMGGEAPTAPTSNTPASSGEPDAAALDQAFRDARHHDRDEEAVQLGEKLIALPSDQVPDRSHVHLFLGRRKASAGALAEAIQILSLGADFDRKHNNGAKAAELDLARAQVLSKEGKQDDAAELISETAHKHSKELSIVARATEMLLSMKRGKEAVAIGEAGLKEATHQQNRDAEGHLSELLGAAKRLV